MSSSFSMKQLAGAALFLVLAVAVFVKDAQAQSPLGSSEIRQCLSIQNAIQLSVQRDPDVLVAQQAEESAAASVTEARALYRPSVSVFGRSGFGDAGAVDNSVSSQIGLRASQRVFDFGDAKYARAFARANEKATVEETQTVRLQTALETGLAWLDYLEASDQMTLTNEREQYFERQLNAVDQALLEGGATRTERATVASRLADAQSFALELKFRRSRSQTQLEIDTGQTLNPCSSDNYIDTASTSLVLPDRVVSRALSNNPEINALRHRAKAAEADRDRRKRARLPVINLVATGSYASFDRFDNFRFRDRIGVDVSIPLYSGGTLSAGNRRASAQLSIVKGQLLDAERAIETDIRIAMDRIEFLRKQQKARAEVEDQARLQFEAAQIEQRAGTQTLRELIEIRLEFESASLQSVRTRYDLLREQMRLLMITGELAAA